MVCARTFERTEHSNIRTGARNKVRTIEKNIADSPKEDL